MKADSNSKPQFQQTFQAGTQFQSLFETLLEARKLQECSTIDQKQQAESNLAAKLTAKTSLITGQLEELVCHPEYSRHVIGIRDGWTGIICRWQRGSLSPIHGHPAFTFYHVIGGLFAMDIYQRTVGKRVKPEDHRLLAAGDSFWENGKEGQYDNLIHRVWAKSGGFTLHLFSDDPAKGECFYV